MKPCKMYFHISNFKWFNLKHNDQITRIILNYAFDTSNYELWQKEK